MLSEEEKREAKRATRALNAIAEATGAKSYYPKELKDVDGVCQQVAHDIRSQYIIEYSPTNAALDGYVPQDQGGGQRAQQARRADAVRLLRDAGQIGARRQRPMTIARRAVAALARVPAYVPGAVRTCAGAWKPTGGCTPTNRTCANSEGSFGRIEPTCALPPLGARR